MNAKRLVAAALVVSGVHLKKLTRTDELREGGLDNFRLEVRSAVRGLWQGRFTLFVFMESLSYAINRGITRGWADGAAVCGVLPDEYTPEEIEAKAQLINSQFQHILPFAYAIIENSRANGGKLTPLFQRAEMWINQYESAKIQAQGFACADRKYMWVLGPTEHCDTCAGLAGRVKRMSYWLAHVLPRNAPNEQLACGGWRCQCTLEPTDESLSRGPLPGV